jgi:hypothetical protein
VRSLAGAEEFSSSPASRPALGPTQPPIQWVPGGPFLGGKARPGRDTDHSPPSSAEVKNKRERYLPTPQTPTWRVEGQLILPLYPGTREVSRQVWKCTLSVNLKGPVAAVLYEI